jgi:rSAM/selenodomain-associated transferase 2
MRKISVVIPAFNESASIGLLVKSLLLTADQRLAEIIVVDGGSVDDTLQRAEDAGALAVLSPKKGRAAQMNYGAQLASGTDLYFVHADVKIHPDWISDIYEAFDQGYDLGCYRYVFDGGPWLLKINAFFTRFDRIWCRGGDQTLFISKHHFEQLNGFDENHHIMEDYDIILRARKTLRFKIIPKNITVSSRKYSTNGYFKVLRANSTVMRGYLKGGDTAELAATYKRLLNNAYINESKKQ